MKHGVAYFLVLFVVGWPSVLKAQGSPAAAIWTIPGIANVAGQNGTHFVSDVAVTNPGSAPAVAMVSFVPSGVYSGVPFFLNPGQTVVWKNVLQQLWGASTSGAIQIASDGTPLLIRARSYNDAASGTFGVALPVYTDDRFLVEGDTGHSLWVSQSPDPTRGYRTNISVIFPDAGGGAATVTIYDGTGNQIGHSDFTLASAGVQQLGVGKFASAANVARATLEVKSGRAAGYSAVVDNTTGDSSLFTFDDLPGGPQDVLANGVARSNGKNNTFFRTDGRFFNPGTADVTVTAAFHASGNSNPTPVTKSFNVPAGTILDATDVLGTLVGLPVGSAGAVRFTSDAPVGILCRTSNVDPTGVVPGTYGSQQKPVPLLSFLSSADAGAVITGVRQNAAYRTNIAMASGGDGATAQFTLKTAQGATAATATQTLGAYGWWQSAVDKLFGVAIPDDAEIDVKLTQGSADVYDASVDNASGDSVVTPAPGLPVSIATSATIGPGGGSIRSDDGRLTLKIPAGALAAPASFSITTGANGAPGGVGAGYKISDPGVAFLHPVRMVFSYGPSDTNGSAPGYLGLAWQGASSWYTPSRQSVDTWARTVTMDLPALQLVAARAPSEKAARALAHGEQYYDPYIALGIVGPGLVLQGDSVTYKVIQVVRTPQSQGILRLAPEAELQNFSYTWSLEEAAQGGSVVGTVTPGVLPSYATYAAPACPPPARLHLQVRVTDFASGGPIGYMTKRIRVLWKNWKFTITENDHPSCYYGVAFSDGSQIEVDFSLDADGSETNVRTIGASSSNGVSTCPPTFQCTATQTNPAPIRVDTFNASYYERTDRVIFSSDWVHKGSTQITLHCPDPYGTITKDASPGVPDQSIDVPVDPFAGGIEQNSDVLSDWAIELRPLKGSCP